MIPAITQNTLNVSFLGIVTHQGVMVKLSSLHHTRLLIASNTQWVLGRAFAGVALLATGRQLSTRHQTFARARTTQAKRVSSSGNTGASSPGSILDVVAIACYTLTPIARSVCDTMPTLVYALLFVLETW